MKNRTGRKNRGLRITLWASGTVLLALLCAAFILLIKVKGNISYLYNFFVKTRGSLPVVRFETEPTTGIREPYATDETAPEKFLLGTALEVNGERCETYARTAQIGLSAEEREHFPCATGIPTFRGNYKRSITAFGSLSGDGTAIAQTWQVKTGRFLKDDGVNYWSGNGWTGQPLAIQWSTYWKQTMNLYPQAKAKEGLVELIYPGMDGKILFLDMETGESTRDAISVGMTFKGTCSLHPEYPLLICGSGDSATGPFGEQVSARFFIYNLLTGEKLYEFAANDTFAPRTWHGFDSSPIFATEADTVICPGENGVLCTVHLNTAYDEESRVLTIHPDETVKYVYTSFAAGERYEASENGNGSGSESSAVIWEHYLFFGDNGGIFQCLNLNTMQPVWVQDLFEDINSSPILEFSDDGVFLYVGTTLKFHTDRHHLGQAGIYKINALNGQILWCKPYEVHTVLGLAGGVLSTGASGTGEVADYLFYAVSKTPGVDSGYLVAISKQTGEEYWRKELPCDAWSSGCLVYDEEGHAKYVQCLGNGDIYLMDARSGKVLDSISYGTNIESTPVIFGNRLAVGLRSEYIIGAEIR